MKTCTLVASLALSLVSQPSLAEVSWGPNDREIVLGQSASFTGSYASQAISYRDGAIAYFGFINQNGGIHGRKIRLVSLDDAYNVDRAIENTNKLLREEKILALFNYTWTNTVRAGLAISEKSKVPFFAPYTGFAELYTEKYPYLFTTRASFSDELEQIIKHLRTIGITKIGLVHNDSDSGRELLAETTKHIQSNKMQLVASASMKINSGDPSSAVKVLSQDPPQALIIGAAGSDAVQFIREFEKIRPGRTQYYARSQIGVKHLITELGPLAVGLSVSQTAPHPMKNKAISTEYRALLSKSNPQAIPDHIGLEGMISAKVLVEALRRAGPALTREAFIQSLERMNEYDVGGYTLKFSPQKHSGSHFVDITHIGQGGRIID